MGYVAGKNIIVTRDNKEVELKAGEPFPEAPNLPTFRALLNTGRAVWMPDEAAALGNASPSQVASTQLKGRAK